jgi:hypothetical protein
MKLGDFSKKRIYAKEDVAPEGENNAICIDWIDKGSQPKFDGTGFRDVIAFRWLVEAKDSKGRNIMVEKWVTKSNSPLSALVKMLNMWRGKSMSQEEIDKFDLDALIKIPCRLDIEHTEKKTGGTRANVVSVRPLKGVTPDIDCEGYTRSRDRIVK